MLILRPLREELKEFDSGAVMVEALLSIQDDLMAFVEKSVLVGFTEEHEADQSGQEDDAARLREL